MSSLRKIIKQVFPALVTSVLVAGLFCTYLVLVGIPKTQARNLYNDAQAAKSAGDSTQYLALLARAYAAWPEGYIGDELKFTQN